MLCQFTFKNYKSYRDETILDMQAVSSQGFEHSLLPDGNKQELLPVAAIYGPNAGGKSNVLDALKCLHSLVVFPILLFRGQTTAQAVNCVPFLFDEKTPEEPTEFEIFFIPDAEFEYRYQISVQKGKIVEENLYRIVRIECLDYRQISQSQPYTGNTEEEEPYHHDRSEHLSDRARSASLDHEEHTYYGYGDNEDHDLALSEQLVHERYASETFDSCRNCDRRSKDSVCQHGASAYHCRDNKPFAAAPYKAVKGKYSALTVVVRSQSYHYMLYCCQKRYSPNYE